MQQQIEKLLEDIKKDYGCFDAPNRGDGLKDKVKLEMNKEFAEGLSYKEGKKYIKIIKKLGCNTMVWGFIVKEDSGKFRKGDILKAAGWNAPATNKARGNILDGGYTIRWTGPLYLN